jgi:hypothetical protein
LYGAETLDTSGSRASISGKFWNVLEKDVRTKEVKQHRNVLHVK